MDVTVHGPLRGVTGSKTLSVSGFEGDPTVREVLGRLADAHPRTEPHLFADDGTVRGSVRVLLDGETAELDATCPATAAVGIVPAVRGGRRTRRENATRGIQPARVQPP